MVIAVAILQLLIILINMIADAVSVSEVKGRTFYQANLSGRGSPVLSIGR